MIHGILLFLWISIVIVFIPYMYGTFEGEDVTNDVATQIGLNASNPNELALRIYSWEQQNFANPYSVEPEKLPFAERVLAGFGFYQNKQGEIRLFRPFGVFPVPPEWVLHSKLANCREYAEVFVYLMNEAGFKARVVRAPGEDHSWAEYYVGEYKIIFDPSNPRNPVIVNPKQFGKLKNFSHVEAYELMNPGHKEDVSDEYIERGMIVVNAIKNNKPVSGVTVKVMSTYLMERFPERYKKPRPVVVNTTGKDGTAQFKLGPKEYKIVGRKCLFPICWKGETTGKVVAGSTTYATLTLKMDYMTTGMFLTLLGTLVGILVVRFRKRYGNQRSKGSGDLG
ncbi:hypothetical protein APY94_00060 [Thermococcus celericrescens]|uniref:Transglutaminase-like domain-containing protein n=2 Tax=Thermococcus celericrescens TaxID=227598 RepID=A0A117ITZ5_9EURY|nr:hypothetical protein APY94_00060 [Thermococcus celericrescens]